MDSKFYMPLTYLVMLMCGLISSNSYLMINTLLPRLRHYTTPPSPWGLLLLPFVIAIALEGYQLVRWRAGVSQLSGTYGSVLDLLNPIAVGIVLGGATWMTVSLVLPK
jgi:hypothetical protein